MFANTTQEKTKLDQNNEIAQSIKQHFEDFIETRPEEYLISQNFGKWAKAVQGFWFKKCGEDIGKAKVLMGEIPSIAVRPIVKPKQGDVRAMVLPGGGDLTTRVWASMRVKINSLVKWQALGARTTSAATDAINKLEDFTVGAGELLDHIWKDVPEKEALQIKVETIFLIGIWQTGTVQCQRSSKAC